MGKGCLLGKFARARGGSRAAATFTWDCCPGGLASWLGDAQSLSSSISSLFSLTTFLNKLALTLVTDAIISLCFVIVLSDCQSPVPEQSAHSSGLQVGAHLLPKHFLSFIVLFWLLFPIWTGASSSRSAGKGRGWRGLPRPSFIAHSSPWFLGVGEYQQTRHYMPGTYYFFAFSTCP